MEADITKLISLPKKVLTLIYIYTLLKSKNIYDFFVVYFTYNAILFTRDLLNYSLKT